jgi:Raf kinase inhibitor-like YbhB/YbcL family protein
MSEVLEQLRNKSSIAVKEIFDSIEIGDESDSGDDDNPDDVFEDETSESDVEAGNGDTRTSERSPLSLWASLIWVIVALVVIISVSMALAGPSVQNPTAKNSATSSVTPAPQRTAPPAVEIQTPIPPPVPRPTLATQPEVPSISPTTRATPPPQQAAASPVVEEGVISTAFQMTSSAFGDEQAIPAIYSRDGGNLSPPLQWSNIPEGTESLVLFLNDQDDHAHPHWFVHWMVYNIPGRVTSFDEGVIFRDGAVVLSNSWGLARYDGPQPPSNETHRYIFQLHALDTTLILNDTTFESNGHILKNHVQDAMKNHVLEEIALTGTFTGP